MSWTQKQLADAPVEIIDGDRGKNYPSQNELLDQGYCLFLSATNVTKDGFAFDKCQFVTEQKDNALRKGRVRRNDVVLTTRGTLGNVAYYSDSVPFKSMRINSGMVTIQTDESELLPRYLYYFLKSELFQAQVRALQSGAAQPQLPIRDIKKINVSYPDTVVQERIADTVGFYDDLIENNRRRIALLEEAARLLYREWFVHFRFPGHEHVKIIDGAPEGWEKTTLGEVADTNPESYKKGKLPEKLNYIDISSVSQGRINYKTEMDSEDAPGRARRIARHGDTIWSNVRPNLRAYSIVLNPEDDDVFSTGFTILRANKIGPAFLYFFVTSDAFVEHLVNHATGTSYPAARPEDFEKSDVVVPPDDLLVSFEEFCEPIFRQIELLNKKGTDAAKARDLLLPRLMDGRLEV